MLRHVLLSFRVVLLFSSCLLLSVLLGSMFWLGCFSCHVKHFGLHIASHLGSFSVGRAQAAPLHTESDSEPGEMKITCYLRLIGAFPDECIIPERKSARISPNGLVSKSHSTALVWEHFGFKVIILKFFIYINVCKVTITE